MDENFPLTAVVETRAQTLRSIQATPAAICSDIPPENAIMVGLRRQSADSASREQTLGGATAHFRISAPRTALAGATENRH
jgi:hypothetical protein